jgi:hypothetical protein
MSLKPAFSTQLSAFSPRAVWLKISSMVGMVAGSDDRRDRVIARDRKTPVGIYNLKPGGIVRMP